MQRVQADLDRSRYTGEFLNLVYIGGADPHWIVGLVGRGYQVDSSPLTEYPGTEAIAAVEVALSAKDALIGILQIEWPTCPAHMGFPVNPTLDTNGRAMWHCNRTDPHFLAEIGFLDGGR
jgi:hypothetical protein